MATIDQYGNIVTSPTNTTTSPLTVTDSGGQITSVPKTYTTGQIMPVTKTSTDFATNFLNPAPLSGPNLVSGPVYSATSPTKVVSSSAPAADRQAQTQASATDLLTAITGAETKITSDTGSTNNTPQPTDINGGVTYWQIPGGAQITVQPGGTPPAGATQTDISGNSLTSASTITQGSSIVPDYTNDPKVKAAQDLIDATNRALGIFTPDEQSVINTAGDTAGAAYNSAIDDSIKSKYYGMPEAIQSALRDGGEMNTQLTGTSAAPGQEGFNVGSVVGRGGELEKISSAYDFNIKNLQDQKQAAILAAKSAAQLAIQTGKETHHQAAIDAYDKAVSASQKQQELITQRTTALAALAKVQQSTNNVANLMKKYPDAGLTIDDTPESAQLKLQNSPLYQKAIGAASIASDASKKYPDAGIVFGDTAQDIQTKLQNSKLYQKAIGASAAGGALDPAALDMAAKLFLQTGSLPAMGNGGTAMKAQILNRAAAISGNSDPATNKALYTANSAAIKDLTTREAVSNTYLDTANKQLDMALAASDQVSRLDSNGLNRVLQNIDNQVWSDPNLTAFQNIILTTMNEYAKVMTGQTSGAAVSDAARGEAEKLLSANMSPDTFKKAVEVMRQEMKNRQSSWTTEKQTYTDAINNIGGDNQSSNQTSDNSGSINWSNIDTSDF